MLCKTPEQRHVFEVIEVRIDATPTDGVGANGAYSEIIAEQQRSYVNGMRAARLAAIKALEPK